MDQGKILYICTHGRFGEELVKSAEMIYDKLEDVQVFSLLPGMSPEEYSALIEAKLQKETRKSLRWWIYSAVHRQIRWRCCQADMHCIFYPD